MLLLVNFSNSWLGIMKTFILTKFEISPSVLVFLNSKVLDIRNVKNKADF